MKALLIRGLKALLALLVQEAVEKVEERISSDRQPAAGARSTVRKYGKKVN